jgi:type II secretory ATPase GspE/PulE/Tfp pilus assembly ATPase PilB-like protein
MPNVKAASVWQQLKNREITCELALKLLVDEQGRLNLSLLDAEVSSRFFQQVANRQDLLPIVPLLLWRNCYYLGSSVVLEPAAIKLLSDRTGSAIKIIPITENSYRNWFQMQQVDANGMSSAAIVNPLTGEFEQEDLSEIAECSFAKASDQMERIKTLIAGALRNRASDIHLEPTPHGLRIRYRIDGILREVTTLSPAIGRRVIVALKVMCNMDISESRRPQDGRIGERYTADQNTEVGLDMRVNTLPCVGGEKVVIRLLPQQNSFSNMKNLGFSPKTLTIYQGWLQQPQGMIILTGPTGSGKTSTLYTSLQAIALEPINVITVEDPVEYVLPYVTQTQVHEAAGMTFAAGLRAILRQDPDLIMVGEIRDAETAETAIRAALTGHLVLTTMHTNDAVSAIPRLKDIGPDPGLISDALLGIVAQRLVRKVCPHCAENYTPTEADLQVLGLTLAEGNLGSWRRGRGCAKCFNLGYLGREAIVEVLNIDDRVRQIIYEGTMTQLHRYLSETNFDSFRTAAIAKLTTGVTTIPEILRVLPRSALYRATSERTTLPIAA